MDGSMANPHLDRVYTWTEGNVPVRFAVENPSDLIQINHAEGRFYEAEELEYTRKWVGRGTRVVDVGANVGNHTVYWARVCGAEVTAIEPNPRALRLLRRNLSLNALSEVRLVEAGLGENAGWAEVEEVDGGHNLGGARLKTGLGPVRVERGDDIGLSPEFLKIDAERMEEGVLGGLAETIARCRPVIMIEWAAPMRRLEGWTRDAGYGALNELRARYAGVRNFLLVPR